MNHHTHESNEPSKAQAVLSAVTSYGRNAYAGIGLCLLVATAALTGQISDKPAPVQSIVRTERLELVDKRGQVRLALAVLPNGTAGLFLPNTNAPLLLLAINPDGDPVLALRERAGQFSVGLTAVTGKHASLAVDNGLTGQSASLQAGGEAAMVSVRDARQGATAWLATKPTGPSLTLESRHGEVVVTPAAKGVGLLAKGKPHGEEASFLIVPGVGAGLLLQDGSGRRRGFSTDGDLR